jgi:hypothetical protein
VDARETRARDARAREKVRRKRRSGHGNARRRDENATTLGDARSSARGDDEDEDDEGVV